MKKLADQEIISALLVATDKTITNLEAYKSMLEGAREKLSSYEELFPEVMRKAIEPIDPTNPGTSKGLIGGSLKSVPFGPNFKLPF